MKPRIKPEYRDRVPRLAPSDYADLEESIKVNGCMQPIEVDKKGFILDGHHRFEICQKHKIEYDVLVVDLDMPADTYIDHVNCFRRQLSDEQLFVMRAKRKETYFKKRGELWSQAEAAAFIGVARQTGVKWEKEEKEKDVPIATGSNRHIPDCRQRVTPEERTIIAGRAKSGEIQQSIADDFKISRSRVSRIVSQEEARAKEEPPPAKTPGWPTKRYKTLVIDPPWPIDRMKMEERPDSKGYKLDYPVMSLQEIKAIPVDGFARKHECHLYLWTTQRFLPFAFDIVRGWGFDYRCLLVWHKPGGMTPFSFLYNCEFGLFCSRGVAPVKRKGLKCCFQAKRGKHSEKPELFYDMVRQASPEPRIDVFNRRAIEGFEVWGNESKNGNAGAGA